MQPKKKAKHLVVTLALYGPNDSLATKMVASAIHELSGEIRDMKKWFSEEPQDVRNVELVVREVAAFVGRWNPKSVVAPDRIIGCPHEEGFDYPDGESCPLCLFWKGRDRFTGEFLQ